MEIQKQNARIKTLEQENEQLKKEILKLQEQVENQRHTIYRMSFK